MTGSKTEAAAAPLDFIREIVADDLRTGRRTTVKTRFPPEPNGYLHIGHAKSICLNFGVAEEFGGSCNLRMDDTNPTKEDVEYVDSIQEDVRVARASTWPGDTLYASDYFEQLYQWAEQLIRARPRLCGRSHGRPDSRLPRHADRARTRESVPQSPASRRTSICSRRMRAGEFPDGARVLRAKIDMASPNINMRDPVLYRIRRATTTGPATRGASTRCTTTHIRCRIAIEHITHSLCTLEFEDHRPLYDWVLESLGFGPRPQQIEFARLNLTYTMMSKRQAAAARAGRHRAGWDDPRMPTISGLRRRGYTPEAIRDFCDRIGVAKKENVIDVALLEYCVREDLNRRAPRAMAVLDPLRVVIENYPEGHVEEMDVGQQSRRIRRRARAKCRSLACVYIEHDDFREDPPKKFFRLAPGREVRLRNAYLVTCTGVVKDDAGEIVELRCTYDPATRGGDAPDGRKVKATLHWVSAAHAVDAEVRLYDRLFTVENPAALPEDRDWREALNPNALQVLTPARSNRAWRPPRRARGTSSSGSATSPSIRIPRRDDRSSTERSASKIPGRRWLVGRSRASG